MNFSQHMKMVWNSSIGVYKVLLDTAMPIHFWVGYGYFVLQRSCMVAPKTVFPQSLKYLLSDSLQNKFTEHCCKPMVVVPTSFMTY